MTLRLIIHDRSWMISLYVWLNNHNSFIIISHKTSTIVATNSNRDYHSQKSNKLQRLEKLARREKLM